MKDWFNALVESSLGDAFIVTLDTDEDDGDDTFDDLSLREALDLAEDGDKIYFAPWVHEIDLTSELVVTESVQIIGSGADWLTLDGGGTTRVLKVNSGVVTSVSDLTIKRGYTTGNGGGIYSNGKLTLDSVEVLDCDAGLAGGGVYQSGGSLNVRHSTIAENTAVGDGGGAIHKNPGRPN